MRYETHFPDEPIIQAVGKDKWELKCDHSNGFTHILILRGFQFDGASIPRSFWRIAGHPMQGDILPAALEHDAEYATHYLTKSEADSNFRENMKKSGVGFFKRNLFYYSVRFFGGSSWRSHKDRIYKNRELVVHARSCASTEG